MSRRRATFIALGLLGALLALAGIGVILLLTLDLRPWVERYASHALDRRLSLAALSIHWGDPLVVEIEGLSLANAPWGSEPDMVTIARLEAEIDPWSILHGPLRYRKLRATAPHTLLERNAAGQGNWRFSGGGSGGGVLPKNRAQFQTLLDFALQDGALKLQTSDGWLRLELDEATLRTTDDSAPVSLVATGRYNGIPARLTAETQSFTALRQATLPFGAGITLATPGSTLDFRGTLLHPVDFDGVRGSLTIEAEQLDQLLRVFGVELSAGMPLALVAGFARDGPHWQLSDAQGTLAQDPFTGRFTLDETGRARADEIALALDFPSLDLTALVAAQKGGAATKSEAGTKSDAGKKPDAGKEGAAPDGTAPLHLEEKPAAIVTADISAHAVRWNKTSFADGRLAGRLGAGDATLDRLSFAFGGGMVEIAGSARNAGAGSHIVASAALSGADAATLVKSLGGSAGEGGDQITGQVAGRLDGRVAAEATGRTLKEALATSRGYGVIGMTRGRVTRDLLEKLSTDLRSVFRKSEGVAEVTCLLGILELREGRGRLAPLRLRTPEANILAGGTIDLPQRSLDVTIKSDGASTGFFALDIPLRVSGPLANPSIAPAIGDTGWVDKGAAAPLPALPAELRPLVEGNPCRR